MDNNDKYLGDGVYASYDGYHIWLAANHHENKVVALEPEVFDSLIKYREELMLKIKNERYDKIKKALWK